MFKKNNKTTEKTARQIEKERKLAEKKQRKEEKIRREGHNVFWYLIPGHLKAEAVLTGGHFSPIENMTAWLFFFGVPIFLGVLFDMQIPYIVVMTLLSVLFVPGYIVTRYRQGYEEKRFADINAYMEQFLYGFREHKKILRTLKEIRASFDNSPLGGMIDRAIYNIEHPNMDAKNANITENALKEIERVYPTEKLLTIHKFAVRIEKIGGDFSRTSELLLEDRADWEARNNKIMAEKKKKSHIVNTSIILSLVLAVFFLRTMGASIEGVNISHKPIVQITAIILWFLNLLTFSFTNKKTSADILGLTTEQEEISALRHYYRIKNWDNKVEVLKSLRYAGILFVAGLLFYGFKNIMHVENTYAVIITFVLFLLSFLMLFQHRIDYKLTKKAVESEIMELFPRWLIDIALLLQISSNNVQVAMYKSFDEAPVVLRPELKILYEKLESDPTSVTPYLEFMDKFDVKGLRSSMKMLYNVYNGSGTDADIQIKEIIKRNNEMLGFAAETRAENQLGGYSGLVFLPIISAGIKITIDMTIFFMAMMNYLNTMTTF